MPKISLRKVGHRSIYYLSFSYKGKQYRRSLRTSDRKVAELRAVAAIKQIAPNLHSFWDPKGEWSDRVGTAFADSSSWGSVMFQRTKDRAKLKNIGFTLTVNQFQRALIETNGVCQISGLPFSWKQYGGHTTPFKPSIDRMDAAKGYNSTNCRIVCFAVNMAMADWGEAVLIRISDAIAKQKL